MSPGLAEIFDTNASKKGPCLAVREEGRDWPYDMIRARSEDLSGLLVSLGIGAGHRVALMLPNSGVFVASFFGVVRSGAAVSPLNILYREHEVGLLLDDSSPSAVVGSEEAVGRIQRALAGMISPPILIGAGPDGRFRVLEGGEPKGTEGADSGDPPALLQFTSGSTGEPKKVLRTHGQILYELERLSAVFGLGEGDRFLGAAPFSHVNGLVRTMLASMINAGKLYPLPKFNRRKVLRMIPQERITCFGGVPFMYLAMAATPLKGAADLSSLRTAFSASAPFLPEDNRAFAGKFGLFIRQLYGCTETGTISVNTDQDLERSLESVGQPLEGVRVEIFGDDGQALPPCRQGEVGIASPAAITSYLDNPAADEESFRGKFYLPGDLGFKDEEGRLTLTGRKKFLINRGGYEVNPFEAERAIRSHPKVREVVVFGVPTRHGDQSIKSLIVADGPCTEKEIMDHCRSLIADFKIPGIIEFVGALPKTPTGKILRNRIG